MVGFPEPRISEFHSCNFLSVCSCLQNHACSEEWLYVPEAQVEMVARQSHCNGELMGTGEEDWEQGRFCQGQNKL
jgi:hypothetical protein